LERSFPALLDDKQRWPLKIRVRGLHHLGEAKRVALATTKLDSLQHDKDPGYTFSAMQTLGKLLNESHASLRDLYEVSVPEVEELIKIVREDPHVLGARVMGGGFGGNVLALTTRDHSHDLIKRVQHQYYSARGRDGVNEGSVIVSTPGRGLSDIDLNHLWGELIDAHSVTFDPQDIQPVIVAAGKGSRAAESGLNVPKPVAIVGEQPAIVHVLRSIREGLGATRTPVVIVSPDTEAAIREALRGEEVVFVTQQQALGTGDAVLNAHGLLSDFTGMSLVVWSTQPVIRPKTYARTAKLAWLFESYEMVLPTAFVAGPYAPLKRNASGAIESAAETHLENAETAEFGETNIGLFLLKNQTMFQVLLELRSRYWDEAAGRYNRSRGELGFPNEVINALASRKFGVFASPFADAREEQGIKRADDLSRCERFLVQLNEESLD
jgi:CTP:molybdopterin cytidylyltransferase MocA